MKQEIITYLAGPRNFIQGVELYEKYGINRMLKKSFRRQGETETMKAILLEELRKLAGLSEREFKTIRRNSKQPAAVKMESTRQEPPKMPVKYSDDLLLELAESFGVSVEELVSSDFRDKVLSMDENADRVEELEEELEEAEKRYKAAPETVTKMIRFREKFTFLNSPDCPDILKILVSDMFTAYGKYKEAFARLEATPDDVSSFSTAQEAQAVVENFIANREMWDELEYYRENGKILGKCEKVNSLSVRKGVENLSDIDIQKALNNARANLSKNKAKLEQAGDDEKKKASALSLIQKWETTQKAIEEEIEARKKKVVELIATLTGKRQRIMKDRGRFSHPCDRSELGHQLKTLTLRIEKEENRLKQLSNDYKPNI